MKKWLALALCLLLLTLSVGALAAGNVTIALQGENGFNDYIDTMFVWDGRLLMASYSNMYTWKPGDTGLTTVKGYEELNQAFSDCITADEDGTRTFALGDVEFELDENQYASMNTTLIPMGDKLYRMANISGENGTTNVLFVEILIAEDGTPSLGGCIDMGDQLTEDYGDGYTGTRSLMNVCAYNSKVYARSYGDSGYPELLEIDLENAEVNELTLDIESDVQSMSTFADGKLLLVATDYSVDPMVTSLLLYDIESEEITDLGQLPSDGWTAPAALTYDEARGMLYYVLSGSVWRLPVSETGLGEPEEFSDMPLEIYSDSAAVILDNLYILSAYNGVVGRDVTIEKLPEQQLHIDNIGYVETIRNAYFDFTDAHPEFVVSISNGGSSNLIQDMMNRSSEVDIYTLNVEDSAFSALMNRGFLAELGGSQVLSDGVNAMYDFLKAVVMKDGELYAVPLDMYANSMNMNRALIVDKMGYEKLPDNWVDLFAMLADMASTGKLQDFPEVTFFGPGYTELDVKSNMFMYMMNSYYLWLDQGEENLMRSSEVLMQLCQAFEAIDWSAFGLPTDYDYEGSWEYNEENILFRQDSISPQYYYNEALETVPMAVIPGEKPLIGARVTVAFVNPFSTQREAAIAYLEAAFGKLSAGQRITMMPGENEPVLSPYYEENLKYYDDSIAEYEKQLADENLDEETRDMLTLSLEDMKKWRADYEEEGRWEISEKNIERYRQYGDSMAATRSSVWGGNGDTYSQIYQYLDGAITAQQLAAELEKTLQMQRLEGM